MADASAPIAADTCRRRASGGANAGVMPFSSGTGPFCNACVSLVLFIANLGVLQVRLLRGAAGNVCLFKITWCDVGTMLACN